MPVRSGIDSALDKLFPVVAAEQAASTPEPEQLETRFTGVSKQPPIFMPKMKPISKIRQPVMEQPLAVTGEIPRQPISPKMIKIQDEGVIIPFDDENGNTQEVLVKPDFTVWMGNNQVGNIEMQTGQFLPKEPALWERALGTIAPATKILETLFEPFTWSGEAFAAPFLTTPEMRVKTEKQRVERMKALGFVPEALTQPATDEDRKLFGEYRGRGGKLSFDQWRLMGKPADISVTMPSLGERQDIYQRAGEEAFKSFLEGGKLREEYEKLPWYTQLAAEMPGYVASSPVWPLKLYRMLGTTAAKTGIVGILGKTGRVILAPGAGIEKGIQEVISLPFKGAGKLLAKPKVPPVKPVTPEVITKVIDLGAWWQTLPRKEFYGNLNVSQGIKKLETELARIVKIKKPTLGQQAMADSLRSDLELLRVEVAKLKPAIPKAPVAPEVTPTHILEQGGKVRIATTEADMKLREQAIKDTDAVLEKAQAIFLKQRPKATTELLKEEVRGEQAGLLGELQATAKSAEEYAAKESEILGGKYVYREAVYPSVAGEFNQTERDLLYNYVVNHPRFYGNPFDFMRFRRLVFEGLMEGREPTKGEYKLIQDVFGWDMAEAVARHGSAAKAWRVFLDITGLPKALKATADLSYTFRQVLFAGLAEPKIWSSGFIKQVKAMMPGKGQVWYDDAMRAIKTHPEFEAGRKFGLDFTEMAGKLAGLEEAFPTTISTKIPVMRQAEMGAVTISNSMRWDIWFKYRDMYAGMFDDAIWKQFASLLNVATGRGSIPRNLVPAFTIANRFFFSPRFALTPFQMVYFPIRYVNNPLVRQLATRSWMRFIGLNVTMLGLGKMAGLWDVELDPTSSNFGRAQVGNTRFDLWHGYLPWVRLIARLVEGTTKTQTGEIKDINRMDKILHTFRGKLDPVTAAVADLLVGRSYIGEEFPPPEKDVPATLADRLLPMTVMDIWDAYTSESLSGAFMAGSAAVLGANVSTYPSKIFSDWADYIATATGKEWTLDELQLVNKNYAKVESSWEEYLNLEGSKARQFYREEHPDIDASLFFWGEVSGLVDPERSRPLVQKMLDDYNLSWDVYPIRDIPEPFDKGKRTDEQVFQYLLNELPIKIARYIKDNPQDFKDRDLSDMIDRVQQMKNGDASKRKYYDIALRGASEAVRTKYLISNPQVDAAVVFWGDSSTIHSSAAQQLIKQRALEIDIPYGILQIKKATKPKITKEIESLIEKEVAKPKIIKAPGIKFLP